LLVTILVAMILFWSGLTPEYVRPASLG